jgi:microcystin-dependent protein
VLQVKGAKRTNKGNHAMTSPYIGTIQPFAFNFAPRNWAVCNGQLLAISSNTALFSLLGTQYGGNGTTTFALPNLQGRSMLHQGNLAGGGTYVIGQAGGTESVTLTTNNLPAHNHTFSGTSSTLNATTVKATAQVPAAGLLLGKSVDTNGVAAPQIYSPAGSTPTVALGGLNVAGTIGITGNSTPVSISDPYLVVNVCIALFGIFPSRN